MNGLLHKKSILLSSLKRANIATNTNQQTPRITQFQVYKEKLKRQPASALVGFLLLHEITAVAPLPVLFFAFEHFNVIGDSLLKIVPSSCLDEGHKRMGKMLHYVGIKEDASRDSVAWSITLAHATLSYLVVKALLPIRLGISLYYAPFFGSYLSKFPKLLAKLGK